MNKKIFLLISICLMTFTLTSCNKGKKEIMNDYPSLDKTHVFEEIDVFKVLKKIENQESFYLIMGFPACPWCQAIMAPLNEVALDKSVDTIYYLNIKEIRDNSEQTGYSEFLTLTNSYFKEAKDFEKNRINAPTFIKVVSGRMVAYHIDTVDGHVINENGVLPELTKSQKNELIALLNIVFETSSK